MRWRGEGRVRSGLDISDGASAEAQNERPVKQEVALPALLGRGERCMCWRILQTAYQHMELF